jgi:hypothetical protein
MKKYTYLTMSLAAGAFLLSGVLTAQTASTTKTVKPHDSTAGHAALPASKGSAGVKPSTGASNVQQYKDPEDMTTRYRPGNNKTTLSDSSAPASGAASNSAKAKEQPPKKHVAGVKYSNF